MQKIFWNKKTQIFSVISLGLKVRRRPTLVNYGVYLTEVGGRVVVTCEGINDWRVVQNSVVIVAMSVLSSLIIAGRSMGGNRELVLFSSSVSIVIGVGCWWGLVSDAIALVIVATASAMVDRSWLILFLREVSSLAYSRGAEAPLLLCCSEWWC